MIKKKSPAWKVYEEQVAKLVASIDARAEVIHNKRIQGRLSTAMRQVDVWVRGSVIGQVIIVAVECKMVSRPLEIGAIDEFAGKLLDLGADRGVLYSASGMTPNAVHRAEGASNPSIIPVSLEAPPGPRGAPGVPIGLDQPDYAGWIDAEIYRRLIVGRQWLPYYVRNELWKVDDRWRKTALPEEWLYES